MEGVVPSPFIAASTCERSVYKITCGGSSLNSHYHCHYACSSATSHTGLQVHFRSRKASRDFTHTSDRPEEVDVRREGSGSAERDFVIDRDTSEVPPTQISRQLKTKANNIGPVSPDRLEGMAGCRPTRKTTWRPGANMA